MSHPPRQPFRFPWAPSARRPRGFVLSLGVAALVLLAALHGGPAEAETPPTLQLRIEHGRLVPETIEVPANTGFRLEVYNAGPGAAEFESQELRKELVLAPGVTRTLVFRPLAPGSYRVFDDFHPDTGQGRIVAR